MMLKKLLLTAAVAFGFVISAGAVQTDSIREDDYNTFSQGELRSVALSSEGYLMPSYARRERGSTGAEIVWDAIEEPSGAVLCATGHSGRLVRVIDAKTSKTVAQVSDPELSAMLKLSDGSVLVAGAPSGTIYRLADKDVLTTYTKLNANFVWRMAQDADGNVWAATGTDGRLFRLKPNHSSVDVKEIHKFASTNLLDLWVDKDGMMGHKGHLYVAGHNPGLLYRIDPARPDQRPEVVFDSQAEEIRALAPLKDGLALALNTDRAPTPVALQLTMRMTGNPSAPPISEQPPRPELGRAFAQSRERQPVQPRSQVVVIDQLGYQRELWTANERPISDLTAAPGGEGILVAAGSQGRVFEISPEGHSMIVADVREDFIVRVKPSGDHYLLTAARNGLVFNMENERASEAVYVSRPIDAKVPVRWGKFYVDGHHGGRQKIQVEFRLGNDGDPDSELWGEWTRQADAVFGESVPMPEGVARFAQYRLTMRQGGSAPLRVDHTELFYVEPNRPPRIAALRIEPVAPPQAPAPGQAQNPAEQAQGQPGMPPGARPPAQAKSVERPARSNAMLFNLTWRGSDPNNDELAYALYYKERDEEAWKLVAEDFSTPRFPFQVSSSLMADGHYRFKLVASDKKDNGPGEALAYEQVSEEVVVDNTPPVIERLRAVVEGKGARILFDAYDATSIIASVNYDLNNKNGASLLPVDDLLDQRRETFEAQTGPLEPGEYVATIMVTDREGNTTVQKVVFTIAK